MTTIAVSPETKKRLNDLGKKGETYNEIINRLIATYCEKVEQKE